MKQRQIYAYLRNKPFRGVFRGYFLTMLAISLPILLLFSGVFAYVNQYASFRESRYYAEHDFGVLTYLLSDLNAGILRDYAIILSDSNIQEFAEMQSDEAVAMYAEDYGRFKSYNGCLKPMTTIAGNRTYSSIYIYLDTCDFVLLWNGFMPRDKFYDSDLLECAMSLESGSVWLAESMLNYRQMLAFSYELTINGRDCGRVVFNVGVNNLKELFAQYAGGDYVLVDEAGMILCAQDSALNGKNIAEAEGFAPLSSDQINNVASTLDGDMLHMSYSSGGLTLCARVDLKTYAKAQYPLKALLPFSTVFGLLLSFGLALVASIKQYQRVLSVITMLQSGTNEEISGKHRFSEWQYIRSNIMRMLDREQHAEREFADTLEKLNRAQVIALQTQINPHFLLNTLQVVNFSIMEEVKRDCTATEMVTLLSNIMRENLNTSDYTVTLERELTNAERYLRIEALRNDHSIETQIELEPGTQQCYVIRFMLQPLLENAILHGFRRNMASAKICVRAYFDQELLCIQVTDNGSGMDSTALDELRQLLASAAILENKRIGLCNVNMRIRLFFGPEYGLTVSSEPDRGTTVTATFPAIRS